MERIREEERVISSIFLAENSVTSDEAKRVIQLSGVEVSDSWGIDRVAAFMTTIRMCGASDMSCFSSGDAFTPVAIGASNVSLNRMIVYGPEPLRRGTSAARRVARSSLGNDGLFAVYRGDPMLSLMPDLPFEATVLSLGEEILVNDLLLVLALTVGNPQSVICALPTHPESLAHSNVRLGMIPGRKLRLSSYGIYVIDRSAGSQLIDRIEKHVQA